MTSNPNNYQLHRLRLEIRQMATGLNALTQAVADLTTAVTKVAAEISSLASQLSTSEDPKVQALADQIETQVSALNAAIASATPSV